MDLGGLDAAGIVSQLMAIERQPLTALNNRKKTAESAVTTLNSIKTAINAVQAAASKLASPISTSRYAATVSNTDVASVVAGIGAAPGSLSFRVLSLGGAAGTRSGTVSDKSVTVTAAERLAVAAGTAALGVSNVRASDTTAVGSYTLKTTEAAGSGVKLVGKGAPGVPVTITPGDNTFTMLVDGQFRQIAIEPGVYSDAGEVAGAVQAAVTAAGIDAVVTDEDGKLAITGGAGVQTLGIVAGGSALAALGLNKVDVAGGAGVEVNGSTTAVAAGVTGAVTVAAGGSAFDLNVAGPITSGQTTVKVVSTGDKSLGAVASAIAGANAGVTASAVNTGTDGWLLQLGSNVSGTNGNIGIDLSVLTLTDWKSTGDAANAVIEIGTGAGKYTVEGQGNTFTDLLSGVTITVNAVTDDPITVTVAQNGSGLADGVEELVKQVNSVLSQIKKATAWDAATKTGGPLLGDSSVRRLSADLTAALSGVVGDLGSGRVPGAYGISLEKDGTFKFDKAQFTAALETDPALADELLVGTEGTPGVAARLDKLATELVHWERGLLTTTTDAAQSRIKTITEQIERLEDRLDVREANLSRQWSALQSMLAQMQTQSSWLSSQFSNL